MIEADFPDDRGRVGEKGPETVVPNGRTIRGVPGVDSERRDDRSGILTGDVEDDIPIRFAGGTTEHELDVGRRGMLEEGVQLGGDAWILKVAMSIEEGHAGIESQAGRSSR